MWMAQQYAFSALKDAILFIGADTILELCALACLCTDFLLNVRCEQTSAGCLGLNASADVIISGS
jgi:hypothetical protein